MEMDIKLPFTIEAGRVRLTNVTSRIRCGNCNHVLAVVNDGVYLMKTAVTVWDEKHGAWFLRCGECHEFHRFEPGAAGRMAT